MKGLSPLHRNHSEMADNKESVWQSLEWARKVELCEHGIANEDSLLHTYMVIFIALEAMFFAIVFSVELWWWLNIVIAFLAILLAVVFIFILLRRGEAVDRWG